MTSSPTFTPPAPLKTRSSFKSPFSRFQRTSPRRVPRATAPTLQQAPTFADLFQTPGSDLVLTPQNAQISLVSHINTLSTTHKAVLVGWLRHYGCTLCKKQANDWATLAPRLRHCGPVAMVLIGNGTTAHATDFVDEIGWTADLFTDPTRRTYAALEMRKAPRNTLAAPVVGKVIKSLAEGNKQTWSRWPTDAFQQGGAVLVDAKGTVEMFHRDAFAGDHVDIDVLYEKVCAICNAAPMDVQV